MCIFVFDAELRTLEVGCCIVAWQWGREWSYLLWWGRVLTNLSVLQNTKQTLEIVNITLHPTLYTLPRIFVTYRISLHFSLPNFSRTPHFTHAFCLTWSIQTMHRTKCVNHALATPSPNNEQDINFESPRFMLLSALFEVVSDVLNEFSIICTDLFLNGLY